MSEDSVAEQKLQRSRRIRSIIGMVDNFFVEPTEENEKVALQQIEQLPEVLRVYGELSRQLKRN